MSYNINSKTKKQDHASYTFVFIIGFFLVVLSINLVKLTKEYITRKATLSNNQKEYSRAIDEQNNLKLQIKKSQTQEYIEKRARELTLSKQNEIVIILASPTPKPYKKPSPTPYTPNYKLWAELFFSQ